MSDVLWGLGQQQGPDAGTRFLMGYDQTQQRQQQGEAREYQREQQVRQGEQQKQADHQQQIEQYRDAYVMGARFLQGVNDEATYQQRRRMYGEAGGDLTNVPERFDPAYVRNVVEIGTRLGSQSQQQGPNIQREVEYYRSIGRSDMADLLLQRHAEGPPSVASNGDGTFTILPQSVIRGAQQPPPPQQAPQQGPPNEAALRAQAADAIRRGADPGQVNAHLEQMLRGGAAPPNAPGTFPW